MVDWQVTGTTLYCDVVKDEVTIFVHKDWSVKCTGCDKYKKAGDGTGNNVERGRKYGQREKCNGPECAAVLKYRDKLLAEN